VKLRIARHTADLKPIIGFYCDLLGLEILGRFEDHNGYNGAFLGLKDTGWHLEFTTSANAPEHHPDEDDLLVFYMNSPEECELLKQRFSENGISPVVAKNPYWITNGVSYLDPDGYGIILAVAGNY